MHTISPARSSYAQTALASAPVFAAVALLGLVLAYWTWAWLAPAPESRTPAPEQSEGRFAAPTPAARGAFGSTGSQQAGAAAAGPGSITLLGVVAASGSLPAYAVVRVDAKGVLAVREGEEIVPGIRLAGVHADRVVLERNQARQTLALPERTQPTTLAPTK